MIARSIKRVWLLCSGKRLIRYTTGSIIRSILTTFIPFLLGMFIDRLIYGGNPLFFFALLAGDAVAVWTMGLFLRRSIIKIARSSELDVQYRLLTVFQTMRPAAIDSYSNGEIAMKFYRDTGVFEQFLSNFYPQFLDTFFGFLIALTAVLYKKPLIASLYLFILPVMFSCFLFFAKKLTRNAHTIRSIYDASINGVFEFMRIFPYLKSMAADKPFFLLPKKKFKIYSKINTINDKTLLSLESLNRLFLLIGEYSVLALAGWMAWQRLIPVGDVVLFQVLFISVLNSFSGIFQLLPLWETTQESLNSIYELFDSPETEDTECNHPIPTLKLDIFAKSLSFHYSGTSKTVFNDFSCQIKAGTLVALTGNNGSGKTTLIKLLTGYLLPIEGSIEIAGKNLNEWQINTLRRKISYVFQDSLLITGTIRDNITLKNSKYTDHEILNALHLSGSDQFIARLPDGLDHKIGPNGGGLSGGERQKVAIARALIRNPEILVFDEVTNHLDYQSRIRMRDLILSLRGKVTIFMVSHDPELVKLCDQEINLDL